MDLANHLDKLKAFKVIAESRTMGEAAQRLYITQPSLTKLVQTLEASTGIQLLTRGRSGVALTEAGKKLFHYATQTLSGLSDLEQKLLHPSDDLAGHIKIGAYASLGEYLWPEFLPYFRKLYPQVKLSILSAEGLSYTDLEHGEIDILVDAEPRLTGEALSWNLYEDRFGFYAGKQTACDFTPETIGTATLIYCPNAFDSENRKIIQHLEAKGYFFKEHLEFDSFMAVLALAKKGLGIAVLPNRLAATETSGGRLQQVTLKGFHSSGFGSHHFAATILHSKKDDIKIKVFIQSLRSWFKR